MNPQIEYLSLSGYTQPLSDILPVIFNDCTNIRHLILKMTRFQENDISLLFPLRNNLITLDLSYTGVNNSSIQILLDSFHNLQCLTFDGCFQISSEITKRCFSQIVRPALLSDDSKVQANAFRCFCANMSSVCLP